jgi:hypothetical protein
MRPRKLFGLFGLALLWSLAAIVPAVSADVPIRNFGILPSSTQAGGHPDLQIAFSLKNSRRQLEEEGTNTPCDCENARFLTVHAPQGLVGNPHAAPQCSAARFAAEECPVDSQVGVVEAGLSTAPTTDLPIGAAVYNMVPREGEAGLLAFVALGVPIFETFSARTGSDYGLETKIAAPASAPLGYANQILWGVPAHESHDPLRFQFEKSSRLGVRLCDPNGYAEQGKSDGAALWARLGSAGM